ncbi:MAG TPA: hypothetical protein VE127_02965 [Solirubrobacteraceae bacterium]|jgi:hypothetical protein|nr:hypothetical protein [Solirubrobacteraceae bacterium]
MTACLVGTLAIAVVPGKGQIVGYIFAPLAAVCTWRVWNLGVHVEANGIKVVGSLVSRRVAWEEIDCFDVQPWLRNPFQGYVVLRGSGSPIPILAISGGGMGSDEARRLRAQTLIDALNELLEEWRRFGSIGADRSPAELRDAPG